ncbi:unnamed protein product [Periconia digitata]|uniref:Uncharacterized protein n=1 Tax=Periconia digitata TaxID=1303443 RepID=A0A9W4UGH5_9PLEO|nr:unnamed protein product [Periconia digitata]
MYSLQHRLRLANLPAFPKRFYVHYHRNWSTHPYQISSTAPLLWKYRSLSNRDLELDPLLAKASSDRASERLLTNY